MARFCSINEQDKKRNLVASVVNKWRLYGNFYRNGRSTYHKLAEEIRKLGMPLRHEVPSYVFEAWPTIPFLALPTEDLAKAEADSLSIGELKSLLDRLERFSRMYELKVAREGVAACRRQLRHKDDWKIYG
ncbi:hypothetical protein IJG01_01755 [Candidatus Saccharibacteria bacterium]|nr:hypothetical protein [Candidatus Saccharibacteria bacterium]